MLWEEKKMVSENITLLVDSFGTVEDHISREQKEIKRFTWKNSKTNVSVQVRTKTWWLMIQRIDNESLLNFIYTLQLISYGAMITSVKVPSKTGEIADVALGFDSIEGEWEEVVSLACLGEFVSVHNKSIENIFFPIRLELSRNK